MRRDDEWRVEEMVYSHSEWLKYPFKEGAADMIYRFSTSTQVIAMLEQLRKDLEEELQATQTAHRLVITRSELLRLVPAEETKRAVVVQRIQSVMDGKEDEA